MDVRARKLRVTLVFLFVMGIIIIAISMLVHKVISQEMMNRGNTHVFLERLPFVKPWRVPGIRVAVLRSGQTADFHAALAAKEGRDSEEARQSYLATASFWMRYFTLRRIEAEALSDPALLTDLHRFNLLILPMAHCLSHEQIDAVKGFLAQRKGVVLTHMSGTRDADGRERDWSLTVDVTGGKPQFLPVAKEDTRGLHLLADTPVAANTPPGFPIQIQSYDNPVGLFLREGRTQPVALWADGETLLPDGPLDEHAGIAMGRYLGGRFVWLGFSVQSVAAMSDVWAVFDRVLDNTVDWASYRTVVGKATWPANRAAATFAIMPEQDFVRAAQIQRIFARHGVTPAFFVNARQASINRSIIHEVASGVEFAVQLDTPLAPGASAANGDLDVRLRAALPELREHVGSELIGFDAPVAKDLNIERLARHGFEYIWLHHERRDIPRLTTLTRQPLFRRRKAPVLIYQSGRQGPPPGVGPDLPEPEALCAAQLRNVEHARRFGGLFSVTLHSHLVGLEPYQEALERCLVQLKAGDFWLATPGEVARWWRRHEKITINPIETPRGLTIMISNEGHEPTAEVRLFLHPARLPTTVGIRAERIYTPIPAVTIDPEHERVELRIERLAARENRTYYVDM